MSKANLSLGTKSWADRINAEWRKSAEGIISAGKLLIQCKKEVGHGAFGNMLARELDFDERTAQRLMEIGADERLSNPSILPLLPKAWTRLHKLTKLSNQDLMAALTEEKPQKSSTPRPRQVEPPTVTDAQYTEVANHGEASDSGPAVGQIPEGAEPGPSQANAPEPAIPGQAEVEGAYDAVSLFANGLELIIAAMQYDDFTPNDMNWPADMPLYTDDIERASQLLLDFAMNFREAFGDCNDAAMQAAQ